MARLTLIFTLLITLLLVPYSLQESIPDACLSDFKGIYPKLYEVAHIEALETEQLIALVNVNSSTEISIRNVEHGFLFRKINMPAEVKNIFNLAKNPKEMVVVDSKQTIHLVNYYYGVLWSSYSHPSANEIISISDFEDNDEKKKNILVGYTYEGGKKYGLDVIDMESFTILNSLKDLPAFTLIETLKESKQENAALRASKDSFDIINFLNGELIKNVASTNISDFIEVEDKENITQIIFSSKNVITAFNTSDFTTKSVTLEKDIKSLIKYGNFTNWVLAFTENKIVLVDWFQKSVIRNYELNDLKLNSLKALYAGEENTNELIVPVSEDVVKIDITCLEENKEKEYDEFGVQLALGVGLGVPLISFAILAAFIIYNRVLDAKENYIDPNEMQTDTKV